MVAADIRLLRRCAPSRRKRETEIRRAIDLENVMAIPQLLAAFIERFTLLPPDTDIDGMATVFAEKMRSTAANIAPRVERCQGRARKRRRGFSWRGKWGKPWEGYCARIHAATTTGGG